MRYYLDAAPIIYLIEQSQPFATAIRSKLATLGVVPITSELARLECRVKPMRDGSQALLQDFDDYNFKTPDSIHLAAAVISGCDVFMTNDQRLNRFAGITIETI